MDVERSRIAHGLRRLREERNYSQEYVAEKIGKNEATSYSRLEQGRTELKFEDAFKLAALYKVPMEQIWDPSLRDRPTDHFSEAREKYSPASRLNLNITLDGTPETLKRQVELMESVNKILSQQS